MRKGRRLRVEEGWRGGRRERGEGCGRDSEYGWVIVENQGRITETLRAMDEGRWSINFSLV